MRKLLFFIACMVSIAVSAQELTDNQAKAKQNLERAMELVDLTMSKCFTGSDDDYRMYDIYNMTLKRGEGTADVWPYTAALEAVCSVIEGIDALKDVLGEAEAQTQRPRYVNLLKKLYDNLDYYRGSFTLTSYTQTKNWSVYGVHRGGKGTTNVSGIENVYDDQEWIIRELIRAYQLTGDNTYLTKAENLTAYVLDGWDCYPDKDGNDEGGITWGPGYTSKHSCSNGPIIQPLVWLSEIYRTTPSLRMPRMNVYKIEADGTRTRTTRQKQEYYLEMARKVYDWQRKVLLKSGNVFHDAVWVAGGATDQAKAKGARVDNLGIAYETVNGKEYRMHLPLGNPGGTAFTYNLGAWLSGGIELYKATNDYALFSDINLFSQSGYNAFTKELKIDGITYRQFPTYDKIEDNGTANGFNAWFNNVLVRAWADAVDFTDYSQKGARQGLDAIQQNLDYAYEHHRKDGFLPFDLLNGWGNEKNTKGFHQLAFAAEYAKLVKYQLNKSDNNIKAYVVIDGAGGTVQYLSRKAKGRMTVSLWEGVDLNLKVLPEADYRLDKVEQGKEIDEEVDGTVQAVFVPERDITDQVSENGVLRVTDVVDGTTLMFFFASTTGIKNMNSLLPTSPRREGDKAIYDLQGRAYPQPLPKGIYVVNGKKVLTR